MGGIVSKCSFKSKKTNQYTEEVDKSNPYDIESPPLLDHVLSEDDYSYRNYYKYNDNFGRIYEANTRVCVDDKSSEWFEYHPDIKVDLMEKQQLENKKWEIKQLEKSLEKWDSQNRQNHEDSIMFFSKYNNACLYQ